MRHYLHGCISRNAVSMIHQYKVNKGRILCADFAAKEGGYDEAQYRDIDNPQKVLDEYYAAIK